MLIRVICGSVLLVPSDFVTPCACMQVISGNCSQSCDPAGCREACPTCAEQGRRCDVTLSSSGPRTLRSLADSLRGDGPCSPSAASWVEAVQSVADCLCLIGFPSADRHGRHLYATLQPCRAMSFALPDPDPSTWSDVRLSQLWAVSPDKNGFFKAATAAFGSDAHVSSVSGAISRLLKLRGSAGDPRLWSLYWCQSGLKAADATALFATIRS